MKILIAYASKNGTAATCANELKRHLSNQDVTLADLATVSPDPMEYDLIVTGGSVRFGKLLAPLRRYWETYREQLLQKPIGLFFCCGYPHDWEYYHDTLLPEDLREKAFLSIYFGGTLRKDGLSFFDKMVVRSMRSSIAESEINDGEYTPTMPTVLPENIERMATYIRSELVKIRQNSQNAQ